MKEIHILLKDKNISEILHRSEEIYVEKAINSKIVLDENLASKVMRLYTLIASYCFSVISKSEQIGEEINELLNIGYRLLRVIDIHKFGRIFDESFGIYNISEKELYYFYLATTGLLCKESVKVRLDLSPYHHQMNHEMGWKEKTVTGCLSAITLLIRKSDGFEDISLALKIINSLKASQNEYEANYLDSLDLNKKYPRALELLGIYHIAKAITETAQYLLEGYNYPENLNTLVQRHMKLAKETLSESPRLASLASLIELTLRELYRNSIWYRTEGLGSNIKLLCQKLASHKVIDLLPSQQDALSQNLLDSASSVAVVQMPTSAGKTLLAEFTILQTKALNSDAKIIYIVPTRALANQVLCDLREDFKNLGIKVEKTSKTNEVDPSEDLFLQQPVDVLVATPEKLDLLIRKNHSSVQDISLIIVDEAHNLRDGERGVRLELLLSMLKRERPKAKFMLLSPFLPNADKLIGWLSNDRFSIPQITVDWKPSEKIFIGLSQVKKKFNMTILPSAHSIRFINDEKVIEVQDAIDVVSKTTKERLLEFTAKQFAKDGKTVLILCRGKKSADKQALRLSKYIDGSNSSSQLRELVSKFIDDEAGEKTQLAELVRKGIAVHHAGLTEETKLLIEYLIREREITHVCATTTVAQGINFPISTIYIDDYRKGGNRKRVVGKKSEILSPNEFLNIVGRAGRTLVDNYGKIIFPFNTPKNIGLAKSYLKTVASDITSALSELILSGDRIIDTFTKSGNGLARAQLYDSNQSLAVLIQYLVHLINISDEAQYAEQLEELFKDSFGYYLIEDAEKRDKFLNICRTLYEDLQSRNNKGILKYADKTGFSVPSVLKIMEAKKKDTEISSPLSWNPENLFNKEKEHLTEKIKVIAELKEVELGTDSRESKFNAKLVADILIDWVNGERLGNIAKYHPAFANMNDSEKLSEFTRYLTDASFKSSWGMSVLESIVKGTDDKIAENSHIPAMIYYGVNTKEGVAIRMLGAPRLISNNLAKIVFSRNIPTSFQNIRDTVNALNDKDWENIVPPKSTLSGQEWRNLTSILMA